jgi:hypothetical protein
MISMMKLNANIFRLGFNDAIVDLYEGTLVVNIYFYWR